MLTAVQFAKEAGLSYTTVMKWLRSSRIAGAEKKTDQRGDYWEIPASALAIERRRPGRKPKAQAEEQGTKASRKTKKGSDQ